MGFSAGLDRARWIRWAGLGLVLLIVVGILALDAAPARAQPEEDTAAEAPKAEPAAQAERPNLFKHIVVSAGPVFGLLLLATSLCLVALIVLLAMDLRMAVAIPPAFVDEFTDTVNKRRFKEAFDLTRNDNSYLARVLTAGMGRLQYGIEDSREAAVNMVDSIRASKNQLITYLATIGTLGPMLGLVGTVFGMILAFMELSRGGAPRPEQLAAGISHALVVTLLGIAISVPAIFAHAVFLNRLTRISMDVSNLADDLLTQIYHNSRRPAPASTPGAPGTTPAADQRGAAAAIKPA